MLAYVFVHRPGEAVDQHEYESRLLAFHRSLAASPPAGFIHSRVWRVPGGPLGEAFEDWYHVEDWPALGSLNQAAVTGSRKAPHDQVASLVMDGTGAVYGLLHGDPVASGAYRMRVEKPRGMPYQDFEEALRKATGPDAASWKRQMVLGPDVEFLANCASRPAAAVLDAPATIAPIRSVYEPGG